MILQIRHNFWFFILLTLFLLSVSGCFNRQIETVIEIPKDVIITEALIKAELKKNNKEIKTQGLEITTLAPIISKILSEFVEYKNKQANSIRYRTIIYDNNTIEGTYKIVMPGQIIEITIKKEGNKNVK